MGKTPTSSTEKVIPEWLSSALKPLLSGSASNLAQFSAQGNNVLQGHPAGAAGPAKDPSRATANPNQGAHLADIIASRGA